MAPVGPVYYGSVWTSEVWLRLDQYSRLRLDQWSVVQVNNNNNICLKSNIQTSSVDYAPRELTHACSRSETCSRSDTEACDMCYVF